MQLKIILHPYGAFSCSAMIRLFWLDSVHPHRNSILKIVRRITYHELAVAVIRRRPCFSAPLRPFNANCAKCIQILLNSSIYYSGFILSFIGSLSHEHTSAADFLVSVYTVPCDFTAPFRLILTPRRFHPSHRDRRCEGYSVKSIPSNQKLRQTAIISSSRYARHSSNSHEFSYAYAPLPAIPAQGPPLFPQTKHKASAQAYAEQGLSLSVYSETPVLI